MVILFGKKLKQKLCNVLASTPLLLNISLQLAFVNDNTNILDLSSISLILFINFVVFPPPAVDKDIKFLIDTRNFTKKEKKIQIIEKITSFSKSML